MPVGVSFMSWFTKIEYGSVDCYAIVAQIDPQVNPTNTLDSNLLILQGPRVGEHFGDDGET